MISKDQYITISEKYGRFASWAVWADEGPKPKSNIGDISVFDIDKNTGLLDFLRPDVIMVGLNFSRSVEKTPFGNFHDARPRSQDYKLRYAFRGTEFYGAYMTDIIKDFEEKISGNVKSYLEKNTEFEYANIDLFKKEIFDLKCANPLIIAFGNVTFDILEKHFGNTYKIQKVLHYSQQISKEKYRDLVLKTLMHKDSFIN